MTMTKKTSIQIFEEKKVRSVWNEEEFECRKSLTDEWKRCGVEGCTLCASRIGKTIGSFCRYAAKCKKYLNQIDKTGKDNDEIL